MHLEKKLNPACLLRAASAEYGAAVVLVHPAYQAHDALLRSWRQRTRIATESSRGHNSPVDSVVRVGRYFRDIKNECTRLAVTRGTTFEHEHLNQTRHKIDDIIGHMQPLQLGHEFVGFGS